MFKRQKIFLVTMLSLICISGSYLIGRAIWVIANGQVEYGVTDDVVGNNPFALFVLALVELSIIFVIIEGHKSEKRLEETIAKLNSKQERDKDNDVNQDRKEDMSVHDNIEEK